MLSRRLQVRIDDVRHNALKAAARDRRVSVATVVRAAIDHELERPSQERRLATRSFLDSEPMEVGSTKDLVAELDELHGH